MTDHFTSATDLSQENFPRFNATFTCRATLHYSTLHCPRVHTGHKVKWSRDERPFDDASLPEYV